MPHERLRLILVGLGDIGVTAHLPALLRNPRVDLVALVEPNRQRLAAASALAPKAVELCDDVSAVVSDYHAAIVATPPWLTPGIVEGLLARGIFVLAEKPFATNLLEIERLGERDPRTDTHLQIGVTYRHHPQMRRLRDMIERGVLGDRCGVRLVIHDEAASNDPQHGPRIMETLRHGNPLFHEGTHLFDWLAYLTQETYIMTSMTAWRTRDDLPDDNFCRADLVGSGGTHAAIEVSWLEEAQPPSVITISGQKGYCELDVSTFGLHVRTREGSTLLPPEGDRTVTAFDEQLKAFLRLVDGTGRPDPGIQVAMDALTLMEQAHELQKGHR